MTKLITILLFVISINTCYSQGMLEHSRTKEFKSLKERILLVALDEYENSAYNLYVKEAFTKYWNYSKFEFTNLLLNLQSINSSYVCNLFVDIPPQHKIGF